MKDNVFGKTLEQLRTEQKLYQRQLGEKIGICNQTISFWESGGREPDLDALVKISKYFEVSVDFLLGLSEC